MYNSYYDNDLEEEFNPYLNDYGADNMIAPYSLGNNLPINFYSNKFGANYAQGGSVKDAAQKLQKMGRYGDTMLAHINPMEAALLKYYGGSGSINPKTGLPEFALRGLMHFIRNPAKTINKTFKNPKRTIADAIGTAAAIFGGPIGGALGGAARSVIRGDKENPIYGALKGAGYAIATPMAANLASQGLSALGFNTVGNTLQNYATNNMGSWLGNLTQTGEGIRGLGNSLGFKDDNLINLFGKSQSLFNNSNNKNQVLGVSGGEEKDEISHVLDNYYKQKYSNQNNKANQEKGFLDKLINNTFDFASKPKNLLTAASVAAQFMDRKKEKSPEELATLEKRKEKALRLTPQELAEKEAYDLALSQAARRIVKDQYLPEERILNVNPRYVKTLTPEEYKRTGKWLEYYDNPEFTGNPLTFKDGGEVDIMRIFENKENAPFEIEEEMEEMPINQGKYFDGWSKGRADDIDAKLSPGEYVIPADAVSLIGEGNNKAGAKELDDLIFYIRKHYKKSNSRFSPEGIKLKEYFNSRYMA